MRRELAQFVLPLWELLPRRQTVPASVVEEVANRAQAEAPPVVSKSIRVLGSVAEVAASWGLAERLEQARTIGGAYPACLASRVEVSRRARIVAGLAYAHERRIVLNVKLLEPGREADRNSTFLHECAHVLADLRYRRNCRHDTRWRRMMDLVGEPPHVSHRIDYLSRAAHAVATWVCQSCGNEYHFVRKPRRRISDCHCSRCGPTQGRLIAKILQSQAAAGPRSRKTRGGKD